MNPAGERAKRGADCPQRWGSGLKVSEPKSDAGRRTLTLPPTITAELRAHKKVQMAERLASEIWDPGPYGGWLFANPVGGPTDPRADARDFKELPRDRPGQGPLHDGWPPPLRRVRGPCHTHPTDPRSRVRRAPEPGGCMG